MLRRYQLSDIPIMIDILQHDIANTSYKNVKFDPLKLQDWLTGNVSNTLVYCMLYVEDAQILGGFVGTLGAPLFTKELIAYDQLFYVAPEKRSLRIATALVADYLRWAKERKVNKVVLSNSMGRNVEGFARLARRLGFDQVGTIHHMEIR